MYSCRTPQYVCVSEGVSEGFEFDRKLDWNQCVPSHASKIRWMSVKLVHVSNRTLMQVVNVTREFTLYCSISVQLAQSQL